MSLPIIGDVIREVGGVIRELIPDADKRMEIEVRLAEIADQADERENLLLQGQIEVNKIEAASGNLFVAGWRPGIGWVGVIALGYTWVIGPMAKAIFGLAELPVIDPDQIYPIILALLGIGGMRTYEKKFGLAGGQLGKPPRTEANEPKKKTSLIPDWLK